jgi:hypothetical protein
MAENLVFVAKATIKVQFPERNTKPGNIEMLKFAFELGLDKQMTLLPYIRITRSVAELCSSNSKTRLWCKTLLKEPSSPTSNTKLVLLEVLFDASCSGLEAMHLFEDARGFLFVKECHHVAGFEFLNECMPPIG